MATKQKDRVAELESFVTSDEFAKLRQSERVRLRVELRELHAEQYQERLPEHLKRRPDRFSVR